MKNEMFSIKKNIHFSSHNFSKNISDKKIKINPNFTSRIRSGTKNLTEIQNKNNEIKQIIDLTVTHFTIKCAFLCNQIEEMKKEYIDQLKLINDKFINDKKYVLIPNKRSIAKLTNEIIESDNIYNSFNHINKKFNRNSQTPNNFNLDIGNRNMSLTFIESNKVKKDLNEIPLKKSNKSIQSIINIDEMVKNPDINPNILFKNLSEKNTRVTIHLKSKKKPLSSKELAIQNLMKSNILSYDDKLKLRFINKRIYNDFPDKKILQNCKKKYQKEIKKLENVPEKDISITSSSNLSFIHQNNEKETLTNEKKKNNIKFLTAIAILKDINFGNLKQAESLYKLILKETKFDSIKSLFISYLKYLNRNTKNKKDDDIIKFISYIDKNKDLLNQNDMIRENNTMISLYCFGLYEIYNLFNEEINRRNKKYEYKELINKINEIEERIKIE